MTDLRDGGRSARYHVVFYDDAAVFGGHQAMLVQIVRAVAEQRTAHISVIHSMANPALRDGLAVAAPGARLVAVPMSSRRLDNLSPFFRPIQILRTRQQFLALQPDLIVISQGRIELCLIGLMAARLTRLPVVSYIPMAHPLGQINERWHARLRDVVNGLLYRLPHRFVTISPGGAAALRLRTARPVDVLPNYVDMERLRRPSRAAARSRLGLPSETYVLAVLGRLNLSQKGQDVAIRALVAVAKQHDDVHLIVAGDGPDQERLGQLADELHIAGHVTFLPWTTEVGDLYAATDMLLVPSRYEGVPLVMIEAMLAEIPIVASALDGMAEYLPKQWLVPRDDPIALADAICRLRRASLATVIAEQRERALTEFSPSRFRQLAVQLFGDVQREIAPALASRESILGRSCNH